LIIIFPRIHLSNSPIYMRRFAKNPMHSSARELCILSLIFFMPAASHSCMASKGLEDKPAQKLICVDSDGKGSGRIIDRRSAHTTPGTKHLAIQVLVFNEKNELMLHERPLKKVGGGVLDAPTTHILAGETKEQSALRCLADEYGITQKIPVKILSGYSYEKDYGDGSCENEYCIAAFALYVGKITPDKEHAGKIVALAARDVLFELSTNPSRYPVWFAETVKTVNADKEGEKFFG